VLKLTSADVKRAKPDALVIPVCEDEEIHPQDALQALISQARRFAEFSGKEDDEFIFYGQDGVGAKRCLLLGLGKSGAVDAEKLRALAGTAVGKCVRMDLSRVAFAVPRAKGLKLSGGDLLAASLIHI